MCNRRQLGLITFLLCTFIVSVLLAVGKWNQGNGIRGIARFYWTVRRQTKPSVWQRPDTAEAQGLCLTGDSLGFAVTGTPVLLYSPGLPVCLRRIRLGSNSKCEWLFTFVWTYFEERISGINCITQFKDSSCKLSITDKFITASVSDFDCTDLVAWSEPQLTVCHYIQQNIGGKKGFKVF